MTTAARRLRELIEADGLIQVPIVYNPLSAKIAVEVGFECLGIGGYALGANLVTAEPLLTMTECVEQSRRIAEASSVPVVVDANGGFGTPLHVERTVREMERAGVAGINLEDQLYPKRAHYHKGVEHVIPAEEMVAKLHAAIEARKDPDFVIVARSDAMLTDSFQEGIRRAQMYAEAGADMVYLYPNTMEEMRRVPQEVPVPVVCGISEGGRRGRPVPSVREIARMGYRMVRNTALSTATEYIAVREALDRWWRTGLPVEDQGVLEKARIELERTIGLEEHYALERRTVEKSAAD